jgi:hypothetical protein
VHDHNLVTWYHYIDIAVTIWFQIVCNLVSVQQLWQVNLVCRTVQLQCHICMHEPNNKSGSNWPKNEKTLATVSRDISACVFTTLSCWKTSNKQDKLEYDPSFSYSKMYIHGTCAEMHVKILRNQIWQLAIRELRRISIHTRKYCHNVFFSGFTPPSPRCFSQMLLG